MRTHKPNGVSVCLKHDPLRIYGWSFHVSEGDEVYLKMESGKTGRYKITNFKRMMDPKDQYFADLEPIGYLEKEVK